MPAITGHTCELVPLIKNILYVALRGDVCVGGVGWMMMI